MSRQWVGRAKAVLMRKHHMAEARAARYKLRATGYLVYADRLHIHVKTARAFNRSAWKGPGKRF
jgi:hypothetical protein